MYRYCIYIYKLHVQLISRAVFFLTGRKKVKIWSKFIVRSKKKVKKVLLLCLYVWSYVNGLCVISFSVESSKIQFFKCLGFFKSKFWFFKSKIGQNARVRSKFVKFYRQVREKVKKTVTSLSLWSEKVKQMVFVSLVFKQNLVKSSLEFFSKFLGF